MMSAQAIPNNGSPVVNTQSNPGSATVDAPNPNFLASMPQPTQAPVMHENMQNINSLPPTLPIFSNASQTMMAPVQPKPLNQGMPQPHPGPAHPPNTSHNEIKEEQESTIDETESVDSNGSRKDAISPRTRGTSRGVSLLTLIQEKIIDPGQEILTIDYLGQKYVGDLLPTGKILWKSMQFASPSAWAIYVKKQVNPSKKSGCGWNSVKYKGKKLDIFKSMYSKKHQPSPTGSTPGQSPQTMVDEESNHSSLSTNNGNTMHNDSRLFSERIPIKHSQLKDIPGEINPNTLIEYSNFDKRIIGRQQPFQVTMSTNCLLVLDFHCHLTMGEVVGYLGGRWDQERQCLNIVQAFPCKCRLGDRENAAVSEEQVQLGMQKNGLCKVGWYHSHPTCQAEPTLRDIDCQMQYQMKFSTSNPVLAVICSPFDTAEITHTDSVINAFWVAPPTDSTLSPNAYYGIPMKFSYSEVQDTSISPDLLQELNWLADFYKRAPDLINFAKVWKGNMTYMEKLKLSMCRKLPKDRSSENIIQLIQKLLSTS